jgi:hypothetical protein
LYATTVILGEVPESSPACHCGLDPQSKSFAQLKSRQPPHTHHHHPL